MIIFDRSQEMWPITITDRGEGSTTESIKTERICNTNVLEKCAVSTFRVTHNFYSLGARSITSPLPIVLPGHTLCNLPYN
jgi:hypothetical protein